MQTVQQDVAAAFGPLTALQAKRRRLKLELEHGTFIRWHSVRVEKELSTVEFELMWGLLLPAHS